MNRTEQIMVLHLQAGWRGFRLACSKRKVSGYVGRDRPLYSCTHEADEHGACSITKCPRMARMEVQ